MIIFNIYILLREIPIFLSGLEGRLILPHLSRQPTSIMLVLLVVAQSMPKVRYVEADKEKKKEKREKKEKKREKGGKEEIIYLGNKKVWWSGGKNTNRPNMMTFNGVNYLYFTGVTFENSPNHNFELYANFAELDHITVCTFISYSIFLFFSLFFSFFSLFLSFSLFVSHYLSLSADTGASK